MVIDARGRVNNGGIFPGSLFDDRVNLFEYKVLARQKVKVEASPAIFEMAVRNDLKSAQPIANTLFCLGPFCLHFLWLQPPC